MHENKVDRSNLAAHCLLASALLYTLVVFVVWDVTSTIACTHASVLRVCTIQLVVALREAEHKAWPWAGSGLTTADGN